MAIFEVLYKKEEDRIDIRSISVIKHGFYLPYYFPFITFIIAARQRCLFLGIWSLFIFSICIFLGHSSFCVFLKVSLLISFAFFVPDIKKLDLIRKGYTSGGCFVEKRKIKAIKKFFEQIKI